MSEFTTEQEAEIQKRVEDARRVEQWTIAEDTIKRQLNAFTQDMVNRGIWHPFLLEVANTMRALPLIGIVPQSVEQKKEDGSND